MFQFVARLTAQEENDAIRFIDRAVREALTAGGGGNVDPFTSGGAYRPGAPPSSTASAGNGNVDPFTSGGAYRPSGSGAATAERDHW